MGFAIVSLWLIGCSAPKKPSRDLASFSYLDSLTTVTKVNCGSGQALDCMACTLQGEAADQPGAGVYAVGMTIMTRAKGQLSRVCRVTGAAYQFEGNKRRGSRKISKKIWAISKHILTTKETGWTHFWSPKSQGRLKRQAPRWAKSFKERGCHSQKIGDHIFYNENKCEKSRRWTASSS